MKWEDHRLKPLSPNGLKGTTLKTHLVAYLEDGVFKFHNLNILMPKQSDDLDAMTFKLRAIQDLKIDLAGSESKASNELDSCIKRIKSQFKLEFETFLERVENFYCHAQQFIINDLQSSVLEEFKKAATTFLLDEKKGLRSF